MNITIIGGSGFIGTRLTTRLLSTGYKVKIVDKNDSKKYPDLYVYADVCNISTLENALKGSDIVINMAAEHHDDITNKSLYDNINVKGAENICNTCIKLEIKKIIFISSVSVYGFAPIGTDENGSINYFNDYGRTKWLAEEMYRKWLGYSKEYSLTIIRSTVVFGEQNRGNVYNLLSQIAKGKFFMVGNGRNKKSMAYVENVAAFIEYNLKNASCEYIYNYIDKPDFDMNSLVTEVNKIMGKSVKIFHWPYWLGYFGGICFDLLSYISNKKYSISSIRVKKFCSNTMFESKNIKNTKFKAPVTLYNGLEKTIKYEFIDKKIDHVFYTE